MFSKNTASWILEERLHQTHRMCFVTGCPIPKATSSPEHTRQVLHNSANDKKCACRKLSALNMSRRYHNEYILPFLLSCRTVFFLRSQELCHVNLGVFCQTHWAFFRCTVNANNIRLEKRAFPLLCSPRLHFLSLAYTCM